MRDWDPSSADFLNKDELRASLPIEFVMAHYGWVLNDDGKALCPFHADKNPSFGLWRGDDGVERWTCYSQCDTTGDVFDMIQRAEGVGFGEALKIARVLYERIPTTWKASYSAKATVLDVVSLADEVNMAREAVAGDGWLAISAGFVPKPTLDSEVALAQRWEHYIVQNWGWGMAAQGGVLIPHWDADGTLIGAKRRASDGQRSAVPGSAFASALYGSWRPRFFRDIIVTEGETDCVWAGYTAEREGIPLHVLGLPSGVNTEPVSAWADSLRGARTIYLCFDGDAAGTIATEKWLNYLRDAGHSDVRVCRLPLGLDLREARPHLAALLEQAVQRRPHHAPVFEPGLDGQPHGHEGYAVARKDYVEPVTRWRIDPLAVLTPGDVEDDLFPSIAGRLQSKGRTDDVTLPVEALDSREKLVTWANKNMLGIEGSGQDVQKIRSFMLEYKTPILPEIFLTSRVGLHDPPERYAYMGRTLAYPGSHGIGRLPWQVVPASRIADLTGRTTFSDGPADLNWLYHFLTLNDTAIMEPFLAWLVATSRRIEVKDFPLFFLSGSSGAGKSTIAQLGTALMGSRVMVHLGQSTPFVLLAHLSATTTLPVFVDEWTRKSRDDTRREFQGSVPAIYEGSTAHRGTADQTLNKYRMTAPVLIAGEDVFEMTRELERTVALPLARSTQHYPALQALAGQDLGAFGYHFSDWLVQQPLDGLPPMPKLAPNRPAYNRAVLLAGWQTLLQYLEYSERVGALVPTLPEEPDFTALDAALAQPTGLEYEQALIEGLSMTDRPGGTPLVWETEEGVYVRPRKLVGALRNVDLQLPGGADAMLAHFKSKGYTVFSERRVRKPDSLNESDRIRASLIVGLALDGGSGNDVR